MVPAPSANVFERYGNLALPFRVLTRIPAKNAV